MAQKKRRTRSPSRSPKRSSSRSSQRWSPIGLLLAVAVMGGVGLLTYWEQTKNSPARSSRSVASSTADKAPSVAARSEPEAKQVARTRTRQDNSRVESQPVPVPRPLVAVGMPKQNPAATKPVQQASLQPMQRPQTAIGPIARAVAEPPRGVNMPGMAPSVVYAREKLILRRTASVASASTGSVEKGREMRSYSKAGKWHHIAVPTTGIIGWVHEDMLVPGKHPAGVSGMTTGAISSAPKSTQGQAVYPPRAVGNQ
ncbi:hypothetical protein [Phyllobacterium sp. SB3]|uniref:hypothetical protein n=1 Tax=Phyllobacterium sp. SB3 TaxID=3156073 RepID=UPI0032AEFCC2